MLSITSLMVVDSLKQYFAGPPFLLLFVIFRLAVRLSISLTSCLCRQVKSTVQQAKISDLLTFDILSWKLPNWLLLSLGTFTPIGFSMPFLFQLKAHMGWKGRTGKWMGRTCIMINVIYLLCTATPITTCNVKGCVWLFLGNPSQSYRASPAIWDHTVLPATRHRWTHPNLTPAKHAGTEFTYPGGMEGWVDVGGWLYTCPPQSPILAVTTC